jgi:hypothetical protein
MHRHPLKCIETAQQSAQGPSNYVIICVPLKPSPRELADLLEPGLECFKVCAGPGRACGPGNETTRFWLYRCGPRAMRPTKHALGDKKLFQNLKKRLLELS